MRILPAIDLLGGRCVRLVQGRYDRVIEYEQDPVDVVNRFLGEGATCVHVVDLEGARLGKLVNLGALSRIARTGARVQFGGGVRDESSIDAALDAGAERVIVGTRALEDLDWFRTVVHRAEYDRKIALGLDARLGKLAMHGWTQDTERTAVDLAEAVSDWPLACIIYTDIGRDGMLLGPNIDSIRNLASLAKIPIIACGGVSDLDDVRALTKLGLVGVVIGRGIYEHTVDLKEAIGIAAGV